MSPFYTFSQIGTILALCSDGKSLPKGFSSSNRYYTADSAELRVDLDQEFALAPVTATRGYTKV